MNLGQVVMTRGIAEAVRNNNDFSLFVTKSMMRYCKKDWGDIPTEDKRMNDLALSNNDIYIITEWDRSYTTILFTNEY